MAKLSVNVNKVATLRNSRGGAVPSVLEAVEVCLRAGAPGITVHPRADARHITADDTRQVGEVVTAWGHGVEFNIEGDPRPDLIELVSQVRPTQCTLVPVKPGEITSQAGWGSDAPQEVAATVARLRSLGIRVSLFVDPDENAIRWAASAGADRVELYTGSDWASTPGTTWTSATCYCSASCLIWPKCQSAMRSSATRCSWASSAV